MAETYTLNSVESSDAGQYKCRASSKAGASYSRVATVTVTGKSTFIVHLSIGDNNHGNMTGGTFTSLVIYRWEWVIYNPTWVNWHTYIPHQLEAASDELV